MPPGAIVDPFNKERYLGTWHEVARLPNLIKKDLRDLTEEYSRNDDGAIPVGTRAFNPVKNKAVEANGTIKLKGPETRGLLEEAYYLPIYLDYNVLDIDEDYRYACIRQQHGLLVAAFAGRTTGRNFSSLVLAKPSENFRLSNKCA